MSIITNNEIYIILDEYFSQLKEATDQYIFTYYNSNDDSERREAAYELSKIFEEAYIRFATKYGDYGLEVASEKNTRIRLYIEAIKAQLEVMLNIITDEELYDQYTARRIRRFFTPVMNVTYEMLKDYGIQSIVYDLIEVGLLSAVPIIEDPDYASAA